MTHDELLARIDEPNPTALYMTQVSTELAKETESYALKAFLKVGINPQVVIEQEALINQLKAQIRAVVELHKPSSTEWDTIPRCAKCRYSDGDLYPYPCWTIQAITEQLK